MIYSQFGNKLQKHILEKLNNESEASKIKIKIKIKLTRAIKAGRVSH